MSTEYPWPPSPREWDKMVAETNNLKAEVERLRGALEAIPKIAFPNAWESIPYQKACTVAKNALKP